MVKTYFSGSMSPGRGVKREEGIIEIDFEYLSITNSKIILKGIILVSFENMWPVEARK